MNRKEVLKWIKRIKVLVCVPLVLLSGCASLHSRMVRLKNRNENTLVVEIKGTIQEAKEIIKQAGREMGLAYVFPKEEREDFLFLRTRLPDRVGAGFLFGGGFWGTAAANYHKTYTRIGFFLEYNAKRKVTIITIVEEVRRKVTPSRFAVARKIKLLESKNLAEN